MQKISNILFADFVVELSDSNALRDQQLSSQIINQFIDIKRIGAGPVGK